MPVWYRQYQTKSRHKPPIQLIFSDLSGKDGSAAHNQTLRVSKTLRVLCHPHNPPVQTLFSSP